MLSICEMEQHTSPIAELYFIKASLFIVPISSRAVCLLKLYTKSSEIQQYAEIYVYFFFFSLSL